MDIGSIVGLVGGVISSLAAAYVLIREVRAKTAKVESETKKAESDIRKAERGDVLEEWREIAAQQALRIDNCETKSKELHVLNDKLRRDYSEEIKAVRKECEATEKALRREQSALYEELSAVRKELSGSRRQNDARETERIQQRTETAAPPKIVPYKESDKVPPHAIEGISDKAEDIATTAAEIKEDVKKITDQEKQ